MTSEGPGNKRSPYVLLSAFAQMEGIAPISARGGTLSLTPLQSTAAGVQ